ncbi:hypothetical protein ACAW63_05895 [Pseudomonas sp. QE6]|uniref:hypothetical protein n=1 Tax=Pseudomonas sp. QE6 TaxID=3242491 RepID=UPI003528124F
MANGKQSSAKRMKMAERAQQLMSIHFPNVAPIWLWHRKTNDGYSTIPRTMPIAMQAIDMQSKGQPAGHTLFCLWARSPDHAFVTVEHPATFAAEAGFLGERAVDTWRRRMKKLRELNFIATKSGPSGDFHYVLLLNPNAAVEWMRSTGKVQDVVYARFIDRLIEVGAYGEIEAFRQTCEAQRAAEAAAAAAIAATPKASASTSTTGKAEA